ncbi:MAG: ACT domain-containing protein [Proteobacteria bacterium]|nr:ACT domain-containing protein [Pseudomonadota bacterium]
MARGTQLSLSLENKPGQVAKVAATLARAKVNIEAISVVDSAEVGVVRLITSSNAKARAALKKAGLNAVQTPVIITKLPNEPGALAKAARKLAAAKVNVEYIYGSAARKGQPSTIVIGVSDIERAAKVKL